MQGTNSGSGANQGNRSGGLSWSTPPQSKSPASPLLGGAGAKPVQQTLPATKPMTPSTASSASRPRGQNDAATGRMVGIFIAGAIVGAILTWGWYATTGTSAPAATPSETDTAQSADADSTGGAANPDSAGAAAQLPATAATNNITVSSPQNAGMDVVVKDADVSAPTWLVVYEMYQGKPFRALGATMFFPEYNGKGGVISLLRATQPNTTYFIGQSLDDGTHTFTPHVNKEVTDASGNLLGVTFTTQ